MKAIIYILIGFACGTIGTALASDRPTYYDKDYVATYVEDKAKTIDDIKKEKEESDSLASKYAQLYDTCKNK